ncbi:MAG: hypothetical protein ACLFRB_06860 [Thiohalorhabdus sp.]|uniref:hypothetical protein n=1 Tax=Thiohalorhabdus sp. TaxID=3094134 RepID=UPI00397FD321
MARKASVYIGDELETALEERHGASDSVSGLINKMVDRYREVCRREAPPLTPQAWCLLFDVLNGVWLQPASMGVRGIPMEVEDGIAMNGLAEKWGVDGEALKTRLAEADFAELTAIADAAERFWARHRDLPSEPTEIVAALNLPSE